MAVEVPLPKWASRSLAPALDVEFQDPKTRDPLLPTKVKPLEYVDIFVDGLVLLGKSPNIQRVCKTLLHTIVHMFWPLAADDSPSCCKPVSINKLRKVDCRWEIIKLVLGWIVDTVSMAIHFPPHRVERL